MNVGLKRRLWAALLTGIPFGVFKIGGGLAAANDIHWLVGAFFVLWGASDVLLNVAAVASPNHVSYCLLSNIGRRLDRAKRGTTERLLLAVDTLMSFGIVTSMIWTGRIASLPHPVIKVWELAVIANILGVGIDRVWQSWRDHREAIASGGEIGRSAVSP
jgi:hypothetical protein